MRARSSAAALNSTAARPAKPRPRHSGPAASAAATAAETSALPARPLRHTTRSNEPGSTETISSRVRTGFPPITTGASNPSRAGVAPTAATRRALGVMRRSSAGGSFSNGAGSAGSVGGRTGASGSASGRSLSFTLGGRTSSRSSLPSAKRWRRNDSFDVFSSRRRTR